MCNFFSAVITYKNKKLLWDLDTDHHSDLLEKNGIKDTELKPKFVKLEYTPKDGDIFDFNLKNWSLNVDQNYIPDWYDEKIALRMYKRAIKKVFDERFLIDQKIEVLENKVLRFVKNCRIKVMRNSTVESMFDSSTVEFMHGSSTVKSMFDSSTVKSMCDSSTVEFMHGSSTVEFMHGSSTVESMFDSSTVESMCDSSMLRVISKMCKIESQNDNSLVYVLYDTPKVFVANSKIKISIVK